MRPTGSGPGAAACSSRAAARARSWPRGWLGGGGACSTLARLPACAGWKTRRSSRASRGAAQRPPNEARGAVRHVPLGGHPADEEPAACGQLEGRQLGQHRAELPGASAALADGQGERQVVHQAQEPSPVRAGVAEQVAQGPAQGQRLGVQDVGLEVPGLRPSHLPGLGVHDVEGHLAEVFVDLLDEGRRQLESTLSTGRSSAAVSTQWLSSRKRCPRGPTVRGARHHGLAVRLPKARGALKVSRIFHQSATFGVRRAGPG